MVISQPQPEAYAVQSQKSWWCVAVGQQPWGTKMWEAACVELNMKCPTGRPCPIDRYMTVQGPVLVIYRMLQVVTHFKLRAVTIWFWERLSSQEKFYNKSLVFETTVTILVIPWRFQVGAKWLDSEQHDFSLASHWFPTPQASFHLNL